MSTIRTNTLLAADGSTTTEPSIPALDQRMAKAWVNFNGTGTVAIRDSYNVSSITDNRIGDYDVNFTNSISANSVGVAAIEAASGHSFDMSPMVFTPSTTDIRVVCGEASGADENNRTDTPYVGLIVFGS